MRVKCPACQAEMSLDTLIGREADARALADFIARNLPLGALMVSYIALFRPAKRSLSLARTAAIFEELRPDMQRQAVARKGRDWAAPPELWRSAIEQVIAARDKGTLSLPLTSHGYLYEVIVGHADKAEAVAERGQIQAARSRPSAHSAAEAQGVSAALVATTPGSTAPAPKPPPYDPSKGPSRAAIEAKARMAAGMAARTAKPVPDQPEADAP